MARKYQKRQRADLEEKTRQRIVEALVSLHGTIGPVRTTVCAVAEEAGVQRATVYRHFPDEPSMYTACTAHWARENPLPDPVAWSGIKDFGRRVRKALSDVYGFYALNEQMLTNVFRDQTLVKHLAPAMQLFADYQIVAGRVIVGRGRASLLLRGAIGHSLSFSTWQSLTQHNRLSTGRAVMLMTAMIERAKRNRSS